MSQIKICILFLVRDEMSLKSNPNSIRAKIRFESNQNPIGQHWNVIQILLKSYWSKLTSHLKFDQSIS